MSVELLAMHGWGGDSRAWAPWAAEASQRGWQLRTGERGYGALPPEQPAWDGQSRHRIVLGHSLGPHLLEPQLWAGATAVVLLASFAAFVPEGRAGRPLRTALSGMASQLRTGNGEAMLRQFLEQVASPFPPERLPQGPLEHGLSSVGAERLLADLERLAATSDLPEGLQATAARQLPVLIVEAADDQIVCAASREQLKERLPEATVITLPRAGHGLLGAGVHTTVLNWIADGLA
jgi:pimeloyl-[acyl-carrier protein] methyl ester esterase